MDPRLALLKQLTGRTRTDVIALYKPYVPAPPPGKKQGSYNPRRAPLTDDDLLKHLSGEQRVGVYLLDPATLGRVRLAVVDIDDKQREHALEDLITFAQRIDNEIGKLGLLSWACTSSSGHGIHLWLAWDQPQDAQTVRALLKEAVTKAVVPVHVDLFPGNVQSAEDLGTLIALPFSRGSRPLDLASGQVHEDLATWAGTTPALSRPLVAGRPAAEPGKPAGNIYGKVDLETLSAALSYINSDTYETWIRVGMALKRAVVDKQLAEADAEAAWTKWASSSAAFNPKEQAYQWRHISPNGELTLGTVWHLAEQGGWTPPASELVDEVDVPEVAELNETHFLCEEGGRVFIFREEQDEILKRAVLTRLNAADFKLKHLNNQVLLGHNKKGAPVLKPLGTVWLASPKRREYDKIVLRPEGAQANYYNLWKGWTVSPSEEGSCELFKNHLRDIVCGGDIAAYEYLIRWCALTVQNPQEPIGTAVVLRGGRGVGKGTFARTMGDLFGQHYLQIFSSKSLTGQFNSHLRDCIVLFADEAVWAGSKQEQSILQGVITEPYLFIEGKGRDQYQTRNMLHLIIATNNQWSVPAGLDERRFLALNVSDDKKQNIPYFKAIDKELKAGGKARWLWELLKQDLSKFDVFDVPQTEELVNQKMLSLEPWEEWWYHRLQDGAPAMTNSTWSEELPMMELYIDYVTHCKRAGYRMVRGPEHLSRYLRGMLPEPPVVRQGRLRHDLQQGSEVIKSGSNVRFWKLPNLGKCREFFAKKARASLKWSELQEEIDLGRVEIKEDRELPLD